MDQRNFLKNNYGFRRLLAFKEIHVVVFFLIRRVSEVLFLRCSFFFLINPFTHMDVYKSVWFYFSDAMTQPAELCLGRQLVFLPPNSCECFFFLISISLQDESFFLTDK